MLLKASLSHKENVLLRAWQRGYEMAFAPCYPRLHVITDESNVAQAKSIFKSTPNATVRANALAPLLAKHWPPPSRHLLLIRRLSIVTVELDVKRGVAMWRWCGT